MDNRQEIDLLLIEDSEDDSVFFREALAEAGLHVAMRWARDGAEAREMIFGGNSPDSSEGLKPRLIVLDVKMPKLGGIELLQMLKTDDRTRSIPVVIFSSSQEKRDLLESYRLGANSYVVKPMDADKFTETVRLLGEYWLRTNETPNS